MSSIRIPGSRKLFVPSTARIVTLTGEATGTGTGSVAVTLKGATGKTTVDFGAFPGTTDTSVVVTGQTGIVSGSVVHAWLCAIATADHSVDEHMLEPIAVMAGSIVAGVGFTIYAVSRNTLSEPTRAIFDLPKAGPVNTEPAPPVIAGGRVPTPYGLFTVAWRWF